MDMKKMFGNLKRLPAWAWMLILYAALFLRDLAANLSVNHIIYRQTVEEISGTMPEFTGVFESVLSMEWLIWLIQPAILILLFEVVTSIMVSLAMGRRALLIPKSFIVYEFRIFYVGATLAAALLSPILLALSPEYGYYYMSLIKIPVYTGAYMLYYWLSGKNAIVWGQKATIWKMIATIVSVWFVAGGFIDFVSTLSASTKTTGDVVMTSLIFAVSVLTAAAMFLFAYYVKTSEKKNPPPPPPTEEFEEEPQEIFKGFGF